VAAHGLDQPELVERGGPQLVDQVPDVVDRVADRDPDLGAGRADLGGVGRGQVDHRVGLERDPGQHRAQPVVQVTTEPPAPLHDRPPRHLHGLRQRARP
jgi:hypothetical protein